MKIDVIKRASEESNQSVEIRSSVPITIGSLVNNKISLVDDESTVSESTTKKRGRPPKTEIVSSGEIHHKKNSKQADVVEPYSNEYQETNLLLKQSIAQVDYVTNEVMGQLDVVKNSKTLKGKYNYISDLADTSSSLLSTKIRAIQELNKTKTECITLELKRLKELKQEDTQNDDKNLMDMYNAFVNTPVGMNFNPMASAPTSIDLTVGSGFQSMDIGGSVPMTQEEYLAQATPEQRRMVAKQNNVELCVVFDPDTGNRWFENIDKNTGATVPGLPIPGDEMLEQVNINTRANTARNSNLNINYPLVQRPSRGNLMNGF